MLIQVYSFTNFDSYFPVDKIWAIVIVWRIRENINRTDNYYAVCHNRAQCYAHTWTVFTDDCWCRSSWVKCFTWIGSVLCICMFCVLWLLWLSLPVQLMSETTFASGHFHIYQVDIKHCCHIHTYHFCLTPSFVVWVTPVALTDDTHMYTICEVIWLAYGYRCGLHPRPHMDSI